MGMNAEDHPYSVACKCARYLYFDAPLLAAQRAERMLARAVSSLKSEVGSDLKLETSNLKLSSKPLLHFEQAALAQFNGVPRHIRELDGNYHSNANALSSLTQRGLLKRITRGVYQKPAATK